MAKSKPERTAAIIADGRALFLDADNKKLLGRKYTEDEIAVRIDLNRPIRRVRLADIAARYGIKNTIHIHDRMFYHPETEREFTPEEVDFNYFGEYYLLRQKDYFYDVKKNLMIIYNNGVPAYANHNGTVRLDHEGIAEILRLTKQG